jgi:hypothetical protein
MKFGNVVLAVLLAAAAGSSLAGGVGLRLGTTGVGADYGFDIAPTLGGRIGLSGMNVNTHVDTDDVRYDAKVKVLTGSLLLDWSPLGPFRISAGFMPNNNKIDLNGQPTSITSPIPPGSSLTGQVKPETSFAPYLGVGYGNVWTKGINFYFDLGVMFQGTPEVSLSLNCGTATTAQCAAGQARVEEERRRVQEKVDKYKYYPVANIGLTIGW